MQRTDPGVGRCPRDLPEDVCLSHTTQRKFTGQRGKILQKGRHFQVLELVCHVALHRKEYRENTKPEFQQHSGSARDAVRPHSPTQTRILKGRGKMDDSFHTSIPLISILMTSTKSSIEPLFSAIPTNRHKASAAELPSVPHGENCVHTMDEHGIQFQNGIQKSSHTSLGDA